MQGTLTGGASWPESIALSFASGATGVAPGFNQVVGENTAQLWFSSHGNLGDALVSATVGLPSELTGLLELLYAPNCLQGVPVTATSMPTETMTASSTATETASSTITATGTATETATPSSTATGVPSETATASRTPTPLHTETATETATHTPTATSSATETITPSSTATPTETPSSTATVSRTSTSTATETATSTSTSTSTATVTSTSTHTNTATATVTESVTSTNTTTPTTSTTATTTSTAVPMMRTTANVHCRIGASTSTTSLGVVSRGTFLPMRGVDSGGWTPVICFGQNGWISSSYLATSPAATATVPALAMKTTTTRVNCRTGRSTGSAIIGVVPARTTLALRGVVQGGWYPVICFGQNGWISASYLAPGPTATTTPPSGPQAVTTTRVNCRTAPATSGSNVIAVLDSGVTVPVRGTAANGWTPVVCDGQNGWISSQILTHRLTGASATPMTPSSTPKETLSGTRMYTSMDSPISQPGISVCMSSYEARMGGESIFVVS